MRRSTMCLVMLAAVVATYGCSFRDSEVMPLTESVVTLPRFDSVRVELHDGEGRVEQDQGAVVIRAGLTDWVAIQDMDGDEAPEAVAVLWSNGGGAGAFMDLAAFDLVEGAWVWRGSTSLGDGVRVRVFAIDRPTVIVHLTEHGPDDPMCCPTMNRERHFRLVQSGFVREGAWGDGLVDPEADTLGAR